jgi:hypothetical protein
MPTEKPGKGECAMGQNYHTSETVSNKNLGLFFA